MTQKFADWRRTTWGDIVTLEYGKSIQGYGDQRGTYPVYGTNGPIGWYKDALCPHPGVIVGRKGAYRGVHYSATPFFVIDTAFYVKPKDPLDLKWAYYALLTMDINGMDSGSAIPSTSRDDFYRHPVHVPPLPTQRAIAHILGTLDDKIELNRKMNETLEGIAKALFKSWFIDFDPVRAKLEGRKPPGMDDETAALFPSEFVDSELGKIPKGWEVKALDEIANFRNGLALQKFPPTDDDRLPVVKIAQLRTGNADSGEWASSAIGQDFILENGDVVFSWSGSLAVVLWCGGRAALNQHLFKVTSNNFPKWFFWHWVLEHLPRFQMIASAKATTMGHIQRHHLTEALCVVPPEAFISSIPGLFSDLLKKYEQNMTETKILMTLRDALLPKLLSGELET